METTDLDNIVKDTFKDTQKIFKEMEAYLEEVGDTEDLAEFKQKFNPKVPSDFPANASDNDKIAWLKTRFNEELEALSNDPTAGEVDIIYQKYKKLAYGIQNPLQFDELISTHLIITMFNGILKKKKLAIPEESTKRKRTALEEFIKVNKTDIKELQRKLRQEKLMPEEQIELKEEIEITQSLITSREEDLMKLENQVFAPESFDMPEKSSRQLFREIQAPARRKKYVTLFVIVIFIAILFINKIYS